MKNRFVKLFVILALSLSICFSFALTGCTDFTSSQSDVYVTSVTSSGANALGESVFTVTYSDGTTDTFIVKNGTNGQNGANGQDVTIDDIYAKYCEEVEQVTYQEFLAIYMGTVDTTPEASTDLTKTVAKNLSSSIMIYGEFYYTTTTTNHWQGTTTTTTSLTLSSGSGVVYKITENYVYFMTNYHVVFYSSADKTLNPNGISHKMSAYLYGSQDAPVDTGNVDEHDAAILDYGNFAIPLEYVGGSIRHDIALVKAPKDVVFAINPTITPITFAEDYKVGETVVAIGDTEGMGITVTQGIVSVYKESVGFALDGTKRYYTVLRTDAAINHGNSGGGLFNAKGELVGITNGGHLNGTNSSGDDIPTAINYALPCDIIKEVVENMFYYEMDGNPDTMGAYVPKLGVTVLSGNPIYEYDPETSVGVLKSTIVVTEVSQTGVTYGNLQVDDILTAVTVDNRTFTISSNDILGSALMAIRPNSTVVFHYERDGVTGTWTCLFTADMISAVE